MHDRKPGDLVEREEEPAAPAIPSSNGHTEKAGFVASADASGDTWWSVGYTATDGPLVDPGTTSEDLRPVTISIVGAAAEAFRLPWEDVQRTE